MKYDKFILDELSEKEFGRKYQFLNEKSKRYIRSKHNNYIKDVNERELDIEAEFLERLWGTTRE
jgi:hypothetical protein